MLSLFIYIAHCLLHITYCSIHLFCTCMTHFTQFSAFHIYPWSGQTSSGLNGHDKNRHGYVKFYLRNLFYNNFLLLDGHNEFGVTVHLVSALICFFALSRCAVDLIISIHIASRVQYKGTRVAMTCVHIASRVQYKGTRVAMTRVQCRSSYFSIWLRFHMCQLSICTESTLKD